MKLDASAFVADKELLEGLRGRAVAIDCARPRVLFNQGDESHGLYILHSGDVQMTMDGSGGDEVVSMVVRPGSLLGLPALVGNSTLSMSAKAAAGAEVSFVSRDEFSRLMLTEPALGIMILRVLAAEVRTARMAIAGKE